MLLQTEAEGDSTDMLATQHPAGDAASHNAVDSAHLHNGEDEDGEDGDKTGKETNLQDLPVWVELRKR